MPNYNTTQFERMTAAEIHDLFSAKSTVDDPDKWGWIKAHSAVFDAAERRHRAVYDDDAQVYARVYKDSWGVVEFLRELDPEATWTSAEFAAVGTGDTTVAGPLAQTVTAYLEWRDGA